MLTDPTGSISSPGHPNIYPHGVNCSWTIQASPGLVVRLTFNAFSIESNPNCQYDYVELYDNYTASQNSLIGRWVSLRRVIFINSILKLKMIYTCQYYWNFCLKVYLRCLPHLFLPPLIDTQHCVVGSVALTCPLPLPPPPTS